MQPCSEPASQRGSIYSIPLLLTPSALRSRPAPSSRSCWLTRNTKGPGPTGLWSKRFYMTKRQSLDFNSDELTANLKTSAGKGMNAFFPTPSSPPAKPEPSQSKERMVPVQASKHARMHPAPKGRAQASTPTRTDAPVHARTVEQLKRAIANKKHLSSLTFRFKAEELERLDKVTEMINENMEQKISKNDIVRLSLVWLLQEYEQNKHTSVLARVLASV